MEHHLRFFDDYGSGWLWSGDDAARAVFGVGPLDDRLADRLSVTTRALGDHLLDRSAASLNQNDPRAGCLWPLGERLAFDAAATDLLARVRADLGAGFVVTDARHRLGP